VDWIDDTDDTVDAISRLLKSNREQAVERVQQTLDRVKSLEKELERQKAKLASSAGDELLKQAKEICGVKVLSAAVDGVEPKALRDMVDTLKDKLGSGIILRAVGGDTANLVAGVTKDLTSKVKAGDLVNFVAQQLGGRGGGRPDLAMAGGPDVANLPEAISSVEAWITEKLG
jgi:alanyl-tRNA synthetase